MKRYKPDRQLSASFNLFAQACAWLAGGIAMLALTGWITGSSIITEFDPNGIPMGPSTAIALILTCAGLAVRARWPGSRLPRVGTLIAAVLSLCLAAFLLAQFIGGFGIDLEHLLVNSAATVQGSAIGRMSPFTALAFLSLNLALVAILWVPEVRRTMPIRLTQVCPLRHDLAYCGFPSDPAGVSAAVPR